MANVTATVGLSNISVVNTPSNITVSEGNSFVANLTSTTTNVTVSTSNTVVNVAALASVANSTIRNAIDVANISGFGRLDYDSSIASNGIIQYTGVSNAEILSVVDDNPGNIRQHLSVSDNGGFGSLTYDNVTGIFQFTGTSVSDVRGTLSVTNVVGGDGSLSYANTTGLFTYSGPDQDEANARIDAAPANVRAHISASGNINYNSTTGVISESLTTDDIDEGTTNLYYSNTRVANWISTEGGSDRPFEIWTGSVGTGFGDIWAGDIRGGDITSSGSLTVDTSGSFGTTLIRSNQYQGGVVRVNNAGSWPSIPAGNVYNIISIDTSNASQVPSVGYQERLANSDPSNTWQFSNDGVTYHPLPTSTTDLVEGDNLYYTTARANSAFTTYIGDASNAPFTFNGNLDVQGNLNYVNVEDLLVRDNKIVLNYGDVEKDAYIYVDNSNGGYRVPVETFVVGDQDYAPPASPAPPYGYSAKFGSGALWTTGDIQGGANPCSYVEVGNKNDGANANILPTTGEFTIEGWIQVPANSLPGTAGQKHVIFSQQGKDGANTDANSFYLQLNDFDNKLQFVVGNISHEKTSANAITTGSLSSYGVWQHVALVKYAGTGLSAQANLYVDGNYWQRASGIEVGDIVDSYLTIGNQSNDQGSNALTNKAFIGSIDEVRISNTARYSGMSFTPPTTAFTNDSNTIALFHFDGNVFDDNAVEDPSIKWDKDFDKWQISSDGNTYSNIGTISNTIAGAGLTGGGTTGDITIDAVGGYGITVNADDIETNNSEIQALITGGNAISVASGVVSLDNTAITPGVYGGTGQIPTFTVDQQGRLTAASNVAFFATGTVTSVTAGDGMTQTGNANVDPVLNVVGGFGITVNADNIEWNNTSFASLTSPITTTANITANYFVGDGSLLTNVTSDVQSESVVRTVIAAENVAKGDAVAITGGSGDNPEVSKALASNASLMPAFGIMLEAVTATNTGSALIYGEHTSINMGTFPVGDEIFVSATTAGALSNVSPATEANLIQKIGKVIKSGSGGKLTVQGAGRTNATPNLDNGKVFLGNAGNKAVSTTLDTSIVPENGNLYFTDARVQSNTNIDANLIHNVGTQSITGTTSFIGTIDGGTNANLILNSLDTGDVVDSFIDLSPTRGATQAIIRAESKGDIVLDADFAIDIGAGNFGATTYNADITAHSINLDTSGGKLNIIGRNPVTSNVNITAPNFVGNLTGQADTVASLSGLTTDDLTQGSTNLYYANSLVAANLAALGNNPISSTANITTTTNVITPTLKANTITTNGADPVTLNGADFLVDNQNLLLYNDGSGGGTLEIREAGDGGGGPDLDMRKARGTLGGSESGVQAGDFMFNFIARGWHPISGGLWRPSSLMGFNVDAKYEKDSNHSNGVNSYLIPGEFKLTTDYNIANNPEFRLRNDGKVVIEDQGKLHAKDPELHGVVTIGNGSENRFTAVGNIELKIARADNSANATMGVVSFVRGAGGGMVANAVGIEFFTHYTGNLPDQTAITLANTTGVNAAVGNVASGQTYYTKSIGAGATGLQLYELYTDSGLTTVTDFNNYGSITIPEDEQTYSGYGGTVEYAVTPSTAITNRDYTFTLLENSENLTLDTGGTNIFTVFGGNTDVAFSGNVTAPNLGGGGSGTVTSVDSGAGLTGGPVTTSGTLAVGAGTGITVNADDVAVDQSTNFDFTGNTSASNITLKQFQETVVALGTTNGNIAALPAFNAANASIFTLTANAGITISQIPNAQAGSSYTIKVTQDGTGSHALTSTFKYVGGDKTLSTAGGSIDVISVLYDGTDYLASLTKAYA